MSSVLDIFFVNCPNLTQHQFRYIEGKGVKIYDFQKATFSTLYIAGLGVLIADSKKVSYVGGRTL